MQPATAQQFNKVEREPMRWLFTAEFADGSTIEQDESDRSQTRTDGTGSRFSDVLAYQDTSPLVAFHLYHTNGKEAATVDLRTGAFVINGTPFHAHNQFFEPGERQLELIYFRETRVESDVRGTVQDDGSVKEEHGLNPRHYVNRYFIGWRTIDAGKETSQTIAVG